MNSLTLLRHRDLWAVAYDNHILLFWDARPIHPVGQSLPTEGWQRIASGPAVHEFLKDLGIFDQMIEMYAEAATASYKPRKLSPYNYPGWPRGS